MVKYTRYGERIGHKTIEIDEDQALTLINRGLRDGNYIVVRKKDGSEITTAGAVAEGVEPKEATEQKKDVKKKIKTALKAKEVEEVKEIKPIAGG